MIKVSYDYWLRSPVGLEKIVLQEVEQNVELVSSLIKHRSIFIKLANAELDSKKLEEIRTADDAYRVVGGYHGVDNTKSSLHDFFVYFKSNIISVLNESKRGQYVRVTVSFLGERNFNRFYIEDKLNSLIANLTRLKVLSSEAADKNKKGELRLRCHIEDKDVFLGIGVKDTPLHRRAWRAGRYIGQMHTTIAVAMAKVAGIRNTSIVFDPFCGSGTILIEAAIINPNATYYGFDINEDALQIARNNAKKAGVGSIIFEHTDAFANRYDYSSSIIISNPPWGYKHSMNKSSDVAKFIFGLVSIIKQSKKTILIVPESIISALEEYKLNIEKVAQTRVKGMVVFIVVIKNE